MTVRVCESFYRRWKPYCAKGALGGICFKCKCVCVCVCLRGNEMNACAVSRKSEMANGTRSALSANATLRPFSRCRSRNHSPKGIHTSRACICVPYVHKWCLYVVSHIYEQNLRHMYMLLISPVAQRGRMHPCNMECAQCLRMVGQGSRHRLWFTRAVKCCVHSRTSARKLSQHIPHTFVISMHSFGSVRSYGLGNTHCTGKIGTNKSVQFMCAFLGPPTYSNAQTHVLHSARRQRR